ncbi:hypothetical protein CMN23_03160 [Candidatus Saccharibacteria bacterium]|nr:hypothetical protein [Candidatus Saccharibacteria bacterium]|tara:strand:- start:315 stop:698 length:384 start_codon:yes stop_codon:yes gene_type:complete
MFLVGLLQWWYGQGWTGEAARVGHRLKSTAAFFSVGELAATLFAPFRQISAGTTGGTVGAQLRGFVDKTISRVVGFFVRIITILVGTIAMSIQGLLGIIILLMWVVLPLLPVMGLLLFAIGWVPSWR